MPDRQSLDRTILPFPVRGCSPVGTGCGAGFPKPLQGRGTSPRIARIARISAERVCGNLRGLRAVWLAAVHWLDKNKWQCYCSDFCGSSNALYGRLSIAGLLILLINKFENSPIVVIIGDFLSQEGHLYFFVSLF